MENELKNPSRNFPEGKFIWSEFLAEWKTALSLKENIISIKSFPFNGNDVFLNG